MLKFDFNPSCDSCIRTYSATGGGEEVNATTDTAEASLCWCGIFHFMTHNGGILLWKCLIITCLLFWSLRIIIQVFSANRIGCSLCPLQVHYIRYAHILTWTKIENPNYVRAAIPNERCWWGAMKCQHMLFHLFIYIFILHWFVMVELSLHPVQKSCTSVWVSVHLIFEFYVCLPECFIRAVPPQTSWCISPVKDVTLVVYSPWWNCPEVDDSVNKQFNAAEVLGFRSQMRLLFVIIACPGVFYCNTQEGFRVENNVCLSVTHSFSFCVFLEEKLCFSEE